MARFPHFNETGCVYVCRLSVNRRNNEAGAHTTMWSTYRDVAVNNCHVVRFLGYLVPKSVDAKGNFRHFLSFDQQTSDCI